MTTSTKTYLWIEQYKGCGCSFGPVPRSDLPGYYAVHGGNYIKRYRVPKIVKLPLPEVENNDSIGGSDYDDAEAEQRGVR